MFVLNKRIDVIMNTAVLLFKILLLEYQFFPEMFKQVRESVMITKIRLFTEHETFFSVGPADGGRGGGGRGAYLWYFMVYVHTL